MPFFAGASLEGDGGCPLFKAGSEFLGVFGLTAELDQPEIGAVLEASGIVVIVFAVELLFVGKLRVSLLGGDAVGIQLVGGANKLRVFCHGMIGNGGAVLLENGDDGLSGYVVGGLGDQLLLGEFIGKGDGHSRLAEGLFIG